MTCLCPQCKSLLEHQSIRLHNRLVEVKHVHNNTLYSCQDCSAEIALMSVPHRWQLMSYRSDQQVA
ncbi:hypothetical protein Q4488_16035 [Amphritea sp. 1_MG-2023]|uniref:hypothetical protein n=1 Tax=Amphritea sp. 1_MG-2023 TaxID=3062670 RepID=UPI0026E36244|nr:hypothetical protein [Amphritea sp. 1_MG-2023]MDO6564892.1 hypothetical protein [Amphritea sp. 1_MG-2023]